MKDNKLNIVVLAMMMLAGMMLTSCNSWREVVYFQDIEDVVMRNQQTESAIRIKPGDQITIMVFGADKYLIMPYNQTLNSISENNLGSGGGREAQIPYEVDKDGFLKFPVLGNVKAAGLTTEELKDELYSYLEKDIKDVTIFVCIENFRINVLGEVCNPGRFEIKSNSCTFLEGLALAGDLRITADRKRVCLIRMEQGALQYHYIDLTKSDLLDSKYLYLQQNDVIYVPPSQTRAKQARTDASQRAAWISIGSVIVSLTGVLIGILKKS